MYVCMYIFLYFIPSEFSKIQRSCQTQNISSLSCKLHCIWKKKVSSSLSSDLCIQLREVELVVCKEERDGSCCWIVFSRVYSY